MLEYLIQPVESEFFQFSPNEWSDVLRPTSFQSKVIDGWGNLRLEIEGCEVSFSDEMVGIQICFKNCDIPKEMADLIVQEICQQYVLLTGEEAIVIPIDSDRPIAF